MFHSRRARTLKARGNKVGLNIKQNISLKLPDPQFVTELLHIRSTVFFAAKIDKSARCTKNDAILSRIGKESAEPAKKEIYEECDISIN